MQILTVGQSDHDKDAGETAAGGGAQPSGQDLRATMQRKGEPRGGPAGTKAQSQVLFSRNTASLCLVHPSLDVGEEHSWNQMRNLGPGPLIKPSQEKEV